MYNGEILKEIEDEHWLMPTRNRLDRLYVRGLIYYTDYLKENSMYDEIIEIAEKAIEIKPYEESINLRFMEALTALDQDDYALAHYEFFTRKLYNDLKIVPSKELNEFYKKLRAKERDFNPNISLNTIDEEMLKEFDVEKPALCDLHYFKFVYNYEKINKKKRENTKVGIGVITIETMDYRELTKEEIKEGTKLIVYILLKYLKPGDLISKWNERQTLILIYKLKENKIERIVEDINKKFNTIKLDKNLSLNIKMKII